MGTRGMYGFRLNGEDKLMYSQFDSYPEGLGADIVAYCRSVVNWEDVKESVARFVLLKGQPSDDHKARALKLRMVDLSVGSRNLDDVYCLTRAAQGDPDKNLALGFGEDSNQFILDSLFCEFAYVINLDSMELEFYKGFNKNKEAAGRYAKGKDGEEYAGVVFLGSCPLKEIPTDWEKKFYPRDEDDEIAA